MCNLINTHTHTHTIVCTRDQALSFRTRHICRQGVVALAGTRQLPLQGSVSVHAHRTEGVTGSKGREGANRDGNGHGTGAGVETRGRTQDGDGIGEGGREAKKRKKRHNSVRRHVGNGGDLSGKSWFSSCQQSR